MNLGSFDGRILLVEQTATLRAHANEQAVHSRLSHGVHQSGTSQ